MKYFNLSISIFLLRGGTRGGGGCEEFKYLFFINDRLYKIYKYIIMHFDYNTDVKHLNVYLYVTWGIP